jgi:signal transduction histidine kinase
MKTTFTQKLDNWLEKTSGMITLLSLIGVFVGGLFALSLAHDYNLGTGNAFGVVIFLVFFGVCLGGMGTWVFVEKVGEQNTANTAKHLHAYYRNEMMKITLAIHGDPNADTAKNVAQGEYLVRELFRVRELADTQATEIDALERDLVKTEQRKNFAIRDMETAERQRDGYRGLCDTNELIKNALRETHARQVGALVADLAWARELLARDGRDLVEHELADKYAQENYTR